MKKTLYILTLVILIIWSFFYYERASFNKYVGNEVQKDNMNIPIKGYFQKNLDSGMIKNLQELKQATEKKVQG